MRGLGPMIIKLLTGADEFSPVLTSSFFGDLFPFRDSRACLIYDAGKAALRRTRQSSWPDHYPTLLLTQRET